ncbi:nucleoside kinase [Bosea caraganae]|uniref:Nucleoside kinase n=1 Tax=Bosea caraganae TaxID=2763117 RepID=A0A370LBZ6_9HYPH|nr:AAA family ATPase [Bosea caraganae]RDJ27334.1 nucleoside kinase [Bosea caraganae]RDJ29350.1 nucleoside kinase [Bosea caraganae]
MTVADAIIHINGWPGSGKLTIARELASLLGARLLDNHTIINPAEALFDRRDPLYRPLRKGLRAVIFDHVAQMKPGVLILTDAISDDAFDSALFEEYRALAAQRGALLVSVVLNCSPEKNAERLVAAGRAERHKLTDPAVLASLRAAHHLLRPAGVPLIELDVSELEPADAAAILMERCREALESSLEPAGPRQ